MPLPEAQQRATKFRWTRPRQEAAALLAADELPDGAIAARVGISRGQLWRWRQEPAFVARVEQLARELGDLAQRHTITRRNARLKALDDRWHALQRIIEERAAAPEMQAAPGGSTGLLVRRVRRLGSGERAVQVEEFQLDTGLLDELLALERQAAQECGQLVHKVAPTSPDGETAWEPTSFTAEEVQAILDGLAARLGVEA